MNITLRPPSERPELVHFLAGYLADGIADYATLQDAIRAFREETPPQSIVLARSQVRELLTIADGERGLQAAATDMACGYYPPGDGMTYRAFFEFLERALS